MGSEMCIRDRENRQAGLDLISKVEETIRRAARAGNETYFTKSD